MWNFSYFIFKFSLSKWYLDAHWLIGDYESCKLIGQYLTMVKDGQKCFDHGQMWSNMLVKIQKYFDHGHTWSTMVTHGWPWSHVVTHGWPWSHMKTCLFVFVKTIDFHCGPCINMVACDRPWSTMVDHLWPWSHFRLGLLTTLFGRITWSQP